MSSPFRRTVAVAVVVLAVAGSREASASGRAAPPPRVAAGRFLLRGTARLDVTALPAREYPVDLLVLVAPGDAAGKVVLHLRSRGEACELRARIAAGGALGLDAGQVCRVELHGEQQGEVSGRLRSGSGRLDATALTLDLTWDVSGSIAAAPGTRVSIPGTSTEITLPGTPSVPVKGTVHGVASGPADDASSAPH